MMLKYAVASLALFATMPSCSAAEPQRVTLREETNRSIDESAVLIFNSSDTADPLINLFAQQGGSRYRQQDCTGTQNIIENKIHSAIKNIAVNCYNDQRIDSHIPTDADVRNRFPYMLLTVNLVDEFDSQYPGRTTNIPFSSGFFNKNNACKLYLYRDKADRIIGSVLRILSSGSRRFSIENNTQRECLIRGSLISMGLFGAADIAFEQIAYRSPAPAGLKFGQTVGVAGLRKRTSELIRIIFTALNRHPSSRLTTMKFSRDTFRQELINDGTLEAEAHSLSLLNKYVEDDENAATRVNPDTLPAAPPISIGSPSNRDEL